MLRHMGVLLLALAAGPALAQDDRPTPMSCAEFTKAAPQSLGMMITQSYLGGLYAGARIAAGSHRDLPPPRAETRAFIDKVSNACNGSDRTVYDVASALLSAR